jgi:hypothetical protein
MMRYVVTVNDVETRQQSSLEVSCFISPQKKHDRCAHVKVMLLHSLLKASQDFYPAVLRCLWNAI